MLNILRCLSGYLFLFIILTGLFGCSPAPDSDSSTAAESQSTSQLEPEEQYTNESGVDYDQDMIDAGWRQGKMIISFELIQETTVVEKDEQRGSETSSAWQTAIVAKSEQELLVAPDLSVLVPDEADEEERRSAFESSPFYISDKAKPAVITGNVVNKLNYLHKDPNANDFISLTNLLDESGSVESLHINNMHPSLYGQGYEMSLNLNFSTVRKSLLSSQPANGGAPVKEEKVENQATDFGFLIYPIPNPDTLNNYPYLEADLPEETKASVTQQHMDTLSLLNQLLDPTYPIQFQMRAGMQTQATKDELILSYEYSGKNQVPFMAGIEGLIGTPSPNMLRIKVTITANQ